MKIIVMDVDLSNIYGGDGVLKDCLEIFEKKYNESGERLILDNYELKSGTYRIILIDGNDFKITKSIDIAKRRNGALENGNNMQDNTHYDLKFYDYYSKLLEMNKPIEPGKIIHSNNYMSLSFKKISMKEGKLDSEVIDRYYEILKNPRIKYQKKEAKNLYEAFVDENGDPDTELVQMIKEYVLSGQCWENIDFNNKDYFKAFFIFGDNDKTEALYRKESERYLFPNLYNSNDFNMLINSEIIGLPNNNMGMNAKKPYLANKTRKIQVPYLLEQKQAKLQNLFFDYLYGGLAKEKANIYLDGNTDNEQILFLSDADKPKSITNGHYFRLKMGKAGADIIKHDIITDYTTHMKNPFIFRNIIGTEQGGEYRDGEPIYDLWALKELIDKVFFDEKLKSNFFTEAKDMSVKNSTVKRCILESRDVLHSWFCLGQQEKAENIMKKVSWKLIKDSVKKDKKFEINSRCNLRWSLIDYFKGDERMWKSMNEVRERLRKHINEKEEWDFESSYEFSYAIGQAVAYLNSKSKASKKSAAIINSFLNSDDLTYLKKRIRQLYMKYAHQLEAGGYGRENQLFTHIFQVIPDEFKIDKDFLLAGFTAKQLIYEKKDNMEEVNSNENE